MAEEKSHNPTPKKLKEARKEGKVLKSQPLTQASSFVVAILVLILVIRLTWVRNEMLLQYLITEGFNRPLEALTLTLKALLHIVLPSLLAAAVTAILIEYLQVGWGFEPKSVSIDFSRLSPGKGIKKFGANLKKSWETVFKLVLLILIFGWLLSGVADRLQHTFLSTGIEILDYFYSYLLIFVFSAAAALLTLGFVDYNLRRKEFYKEMSMSDEEVRREFKEDEGDPMLKSKRKTMHESLLMQDVVKRVRQSKVIVVKRCK